jgi:hypothetical protein
MRRLVESLRLIISFVIGAVIQICASVAGFIAGDCFGAFIAMH